ncbi:MAG: hypothetical protein JOZ62_12350 [Acidobacteriaceae bacterium]|nr:hypothetical protein [Acidobacteriaceae bacterium]
MRSSVICVAFLASFVAPNAFGQGCVCQRQNASGYAGDNAYMKRGDWLISTVYQNFTSDRHYQGTTFIPALTSRGPTNVQNAFSISAAYAVTDRLALTLEAPVILTSYTLNRVPPRGTTPVKEGTHSHGLGDMTLRASYWVRNTYQAKWNVAFSFGVQAPTGAADVQDTIYGRVVPEDVSVQPGSKAWGVPVGASGFWEFRRFAVFGSGAYLFNPRGTTGVPTFFGSLSNSNNTRVNSSTDQYLGQWGVVGKVWRKKWPLPSLSYRISGVPVHDVFGPSDGFRRPADVQFIEPGFSLQFGSDVVFFSTGILTYVNVKPTPANPNVTDATIPKYVFNLAFSHRVNGRHELR